MDQHRFPHATWECMPSRLVVAKRTAGAQLVGCSAALISHEQHLTSTQHRMQNNMASRQISVRLVDGLRRHIASARLDRGYTQQKLAEWLYLPAADIAALESGQYPVPKHVADMVLFALNIKANKDSFY